MLYWITPNIIPALSIKILTLLNLIDCVDQVLFKQDNDSMNIIIEKNSK